MYFFGIWWHWIEAFYKVEVNMYMGLKIWIIATFYKAFNVCHILLKMDRSSYQCYVYGSLFCWGGNWNIEIGDTQVYMAELKSRNSLNLRQEHKQEKMERVSIYYIQRVEGVRMRVSAEKCIWPIAEGLKTEEQIAKFAPWSKLALS